MKVKNPFKLLRIAELRWLLLGACSGEVMNQGGLKNVVTEPTRLENKRERRRGAAGRAAALRRAPSDSDCSGETASLSADSGDRAPRPPPQPPRSAKNRGRRRGSEWEVLEGLKDGQRFEKRPDVFNGYLHKKRKWPLKGWHKRFFVVDGGILVYARSPTDVARGRLHGSVDVGLSVISAKARRRRIDIDADEFIYHLRAKTPDVFRTWLNVLKAHRLYRQHLLTFGARESVPKIHAPLDDLPPTDNSSRLLSPTAGPIRGPQAGFVSGTPGGRLAGWIIESGGPLENASRELGQAQLSVQQLQRLLDALELQQQLHHDTDVSIEGASPNVKKDRRKFGLRKKKSNSKCASVELQASHIDPSSSHMALSALTAPPSPGGGASSVPNSAASLPIACAAARPQSLPGAETLGTAQGPASLTSLTPDHQLREDFTVLAKDLVANLKTVVSTLVCERGRLRAAMEAAESSSAPGAVLAALRSNLTTALHQNSVFRAELRSRLSRIHDASDLAEISSVGPNSDAVNNRPFQQSLSYSSSCVSASEFFDAEEHELDLKPAEIIAADEVGLTSNCIHHEQVNNRPFQQSLSYSSSCVSASEFFDAEEHELDLKPAEIIAADEVGLTSNCIHHEQVNNRPFQQSLSYSSSCVSASEFFDAEEHELDLKPAEIIAADESGVIELEGDSSSEAGSLSSEEGSASSDNSDGAIVSAEQVTLRATEAPDTAGWSRRTRLPAARPTPGGPSLWNLLYKNIGKDLSQISMPVTINEPLNMLQRLCEELEYSELLDAASECKSPIERMALIAAFAVSAYASSAHRAASKPFNPLLAETYECVRDDKGFRFIAEQVSHHPPISACHAESSRWCFWQEARIKTKFWGKSMEFQPTGRVHVRLLNTGDHYSWNKVTTCVHNLFGGQRWVDQYGDMHITCHGTDITCKLNFIKASSWSSSRHEVRGAVVGGGSRLRLAGRWSEALYAGDPPAARCLWRPGAMPPEHELYYGFTRFAMELNELEPNMRSTLPHTDTRLRPDQRALEEGDVDAAEQLKHQLEQSQRDRRRDSALHMPAWFRKTVESGEETWVFSGAYWKAREAGFPDTPAPAIW
ncbi:oxysterol-binding protein-related protein 3 isoform X4 [Helicoverpa armigera]|uniref:oxysterol-binding protein-related protein 3 isoform X4 n=1 Tax=Helicoverpa armigera TaxID=29058 RepID=UPI003083CBE1